MADRTVQPEEAFTAPRHATLWATLLLAVPIAALAWPMLLGRWLVGSMSDQYSTGYAFRDWAAQQWHATGHIPLWNPELFGGLPFVGAMHGDIFYWTSFLRLVLPTETVMNLGFLVHYLAAGLFTYLLLRSLKISWLGAVVGGVAYELSGLISSYPAPGHDGKLFVTALLPAALLLLHRGIRGRRAWAFALLAAVVGLALLSPHFQMTYYLLVAAGIFGLYAAFGAGEDAPRGAQRWVLLGVSLGAVLVGFGMAMVQILPFYRYLPFSPRASGYYGFEGSTSYAIPWSHLPEFFIAGFSGTTWQDTYWASNPLKLHSEYLGLPVLVLAFCGLRAEGAKRLRWWLGGIGLLFLLISLGSATPFYRVWWAIVPFVKQTRAPGMALYVVALMLAVFAGMGVDRIASGNVRRLETFSLVAGAVIALLGLTGILGALAETFAQSAGEALGRSSGVDPTAFAQGHVDAARANAGTIRLSGVLGGVALAAMGALLWARRTARLGATTVGLLLLFVVAADLWRNARPFWTYKEPPRQGLYRSDPIIDYLHRQSLPYRVLELSGTEAEVYGGSLLMDFGIPQVLGHHGNQLHAYNEALGGKNEWRYLLLSRRVWDQLAVDYVILPSGMDIGSQVPAFANLSVDFDTALANVETTTGRRAVLLRRRTSLPYARLVPGAVKAPDDRAAALIADPRQPSFVDQIVLLGQEAQLQPRPERTLPAPLGARVRVQRWEPGHMVLAIEPAAPQDAYVVVSENFYPDWRATVDGHAAQVVRGNVTQIVVPVSAGARQVELRFASDSLRTGRTISLASIALIGLALIVPAVLQRRRPSA